MSLRSQLTRASATLVRRLGPRAYLWLAALFTAFILADALHFKLVRSTGRGVFDLMVSQRMLQPAPDPDIVIVDIDEASLADLGRDHGRWPWPNQVIGEFVEGLEAQRPRAIVFDILFSDADVLRPESDAYFNEVIAGTGNTFFPMLRLGAQNDHLSRVRPSMLPGVTSLATGPGEAPPEDVPLAIILPQVPAAIANGRLGVHNAEPDRDSVIRRYLFHLEHRGWRIPALATRVAQENGAGPLPAAQRDYLINWRGKPFSYQYVSFADVYRDLLRKNRQRPPDEFAGKIIVIGSTAPSLFDIKASPMSKIHPGVEILATAIDNVRAGDWLRDQPAWVSWSASLAFIWLMAAALALQFNVSRFDRIFAAAQAGIVIVSYAALNVTNFYLDLSAPFTLGLAYFSIARVYLNQSARWLANSQLHDLEKLPAGRARMTVMAIHLQTSRRSGRRRLRAELSRLVAASSAGASRIGGLVEDPGLVQGVFAGTMLAYWLNDRPEDADAQAGIEADLARISAGIELFQAKRTGSLASAVSTGVLEWTERDGWKPQARSIILRALAGEPGSSS